MDKEKINTFYQKWGIEIPQIDFKELQARIWDAVTDDLGFTAGTGSFKSSCVRIIGLRRQDLDRNPIMALYPIIEKPQSVPSLMRSLQFLLWALLESGNSDTARTFARHLTTIFAFTSGIDAEIVIGSNDIAIYPAGAKLLDDKAVKETVDWLVQYPEVGKHFFESLKIYAGKEVTRYRHLLDNLRFSLEQMLRAVLGNQKSLENQREEALKWLASHKIHAHIVNMYNDLISKFASYQNDAVKHNEKYSPAEIEFMIYMTGTFLRFLVQLHTGQTAPTLAVKTP